MAYETVDCVDAGTDYCPCYLSETDNCLICSQLQGKAFCDCINWKGVCIYQEYVWNGRKKKEPRKDLKANILEMKMINDNTMFLKLKVSRTLARELNQPGSYIFLRDEKYPIFFDVPMSIMQSSEVEENVDLLVQIRGIKTKVLKNIDEFITIRGPYWNGIMGLKNLKAVKNKNCLIVTRGISQAPSVLVAKKLRLSNNSVFVVLDPGSCNTDITKDYFESLGCNVVETCILKNRAMDENACSLIKSIIEGHNISLVFSGGSDIIHKGIMKISNSLRQDILFACTNNASICCGEGVCGSCTTRLKDGRKIKSCKAQVDPIDFQGGIL